MTAPKISKTKPPQGYRLATKEDLEKGRIKPGILFWCPGFKNPIPIDSAEVKHRKDDFEYYKKVIRKYIFEGKLYIKE